MLPPIDIESGWRAARARDLKDQLAHGAREPFVVRSGDVVFVTGRGAWGNTWIELTQFLSISRDLANIVVVADYLSRKNKNGN